MKRFGFNLTHLKGDLFGGITAGIVALPLALAFGLQSGLGATAGLYGAIFISFFAALFGGTNTQISGPTAPMTAVSMLVVGGIVAVNDGNVEKALPYILSVFLLAGLFQIALGVFKLGQYIRFIPYPVISGFMTGIGVIILATQILPMLGYYPSEDPDFVSKFKPMAEEVMLEKILKEEAAEEILVLEDFKETVRRAGLISQEQIMSEAEILAKDSTRTVLGSLKQVGRGLNNINFIDLILGLLTIVIIYGFKRITKLIPSALVALIVLTAVAYFWIPDYRTIGIIPEGFPKFQMSVFTNFEFNQITPYLVSASASEIVSGAIQDLDRGVVIGARSFGKGLVQRPRPLTYGTQLKVTISRYYTPSGRCIQALDYWNRDENGDPVRAEPDAYNAFKTRGGRTVYDGGGILPDIELETAKYSPITTALLRDNAIFNYATQYYYKNSFDTWSDFKFTDSDFKDFLKFLKTQDFSYKTETEKAFDAAYRKAKDDQIQLEITNAFNGLMDKIAVVKEEELEEKKAEIASLLKDEILKRYFYREGLYEYQVNNNPEILEAIAVLNDTNRYSRILN